MNQKAEMVDTYKSYEWLIQEKLEQLDFMVRKMFLEMRAVGVPFHEAQPYVQEKFNELIKKITETED